MEDAIFDVSHIHEPDGDLRIKIYDPTAVGIMLHPEFFTLKPANVVEIELAGRYTYGAMHVMDFLSEEHSTNRNRRRYREVCNLVRSNYQAANNGRK